MAQFGGQALLTTTSPNVWVAFSGTLRPIIRRALRHHRQPRPWQCIEGALTLPVRSACFSTADCSLFIKKHHDCPRPV